MNSRKRRWCQPVACRESQPVPVKRTFSTRCFQQDHGDGRLPKKRKKGGRAQNGHSSGGGGGKGGHHRAIGTVSVDASPPEHTASTKERLSLDTALLEFLKTLGPTRDDLENARCVLRDVNLALANLGVSARVFGSWNTGTWIPSSDMDLAVTRVVPLEEAHMRCVSVVGRGRNAGSDARHALLEELDLCSQPRRDLKRNLSGILRALANRLRANRYFYRVCAILRARVPIVKAIHFKGISVDVSFQDDGIMTSEYLCKEFEKPHFVLARSLIIMVKALVASWSLGDPSTGGLGSFPISLMVLWFLESEVAMKCPSDIEKSCAVCLVWFLKYYGRQFDYVHTCIDYANKRTTNKPTSETPCIINPLKPGHNCASAATRFSLVVQRFSETHELFANCLYDTLDVQHVRCVVVDAFGRLAGRRHQGQGLWEAASAQHLWEGETRFYIGDPSIGLWGAKTSSE